MAAAGKALKGLGKAFLKRRRTIGGLKASLGKAPVLGKYAKDYPGTKKPKVSDFTARRAVLRGVKAPKKIDLVDFGVGAGTGALTMHLISKAKKEAKATETKKDKLKEATEKHKKKTKEKRKKYGKHHG